MKSRKIYITSFDINRLIKLVQVATKFDSEDKKYLKDLKKELDRACIVDSKSVPGDVVTMNSKFRIKDLDSGEEGIFTLVFPEKSDIDRNQISVLAPVGTAVIGYKVGDIIQWEVPAGLRKLKLEEVLYQPEAAGDYHL